MRADLHSHSHFSDGTLSPEQLVLRASQMQLDLFAITDHDCIDAIAPAHAAIEQHKLGMRLISGVELSTKWHGFEIHILGLNFDTNNAALRQALLEQQDKRQQRAAKIARKLAHLAIDNLLEKATALSTTSISRVHFAKVLVAQNKCKDMQAAFTKYLGKNKSAYVTPDWFSIEDAVQVVKDAGGVACLAHPFHYDMKTKWLRRLFEDFANAGGQASELTHPRVSPTKLQVIQEIATEHQFYASIGSDFHAPNRWTELGRKLAVPNNFSPVWEAF